MRWNADVEVILNIRYEDIVAFTKEEAEEKAEKMAFEDVDHSKCACFNKSAYANVWND